MASTPSLDDRAHLAEMASFNLPLAIGLVATLGVADVIARGVNEIAAIARECEANEEALYRTMRYLASRRIFAEAPGRRFELTNLGHYLRSDVERTVKHAVRLDGNQMLIFRVMAEAMHTMRTGEPCYERALGVKPFDAMSADPESNRRFNEQMRERSRTAAEAVLDAYDFAGIAHLIDVGGGTGMFLGKILSAHPGMRGTLFELPNVSAEAGTLLSELGVTDRCRVLSGDMFGEVPEGGDAYLLSSVLHDWNDADAARILRSCRSAMRTSSRLLIVEALMSDDDTQSRVAKQLDFAMMIGPGGRERSADEFRQLLQGAGFEMTRIVRTASSFNVVEAACLSSVRS